MALEADRELAALVAREQRGFRFILISGVVLLVLLMALSIAFGVRVTQASAELSATQLEMQREAFDARRSMDSQRNIVSDQGRRLRRLAQDMRRPEFAQPVTVTPQSAIEAASAFLHQGRLTIEDERQIEAASEGRIGSEAQRELIAGANTLMNWERLGDTVTPGSTDLPNRLRRALTSFETAARLDPTLAPAGAAGRAWVHYIRASSTVLSNYAAEDCSQLGEAVAASAQNGAIGAQPLWWRAQCERKSGRPDEALRDYAAALEQTYEIAIVQQGGGGGNMRNRQSEMLVAMNAFHGVGTTLIALHTAPDSDATIVRATAIAERACTDNVSNTGVAFEIFARSPRLQLAERCLRAAMAVRRRLSQTDNQISGSGENLTFAYLADGNYTKAFEHAQQVEGTGLFAWNELMRALAAGHVDNPGEVRHIREEARRHVGFFNQSQFNLCELRVLLGEELYGEAEEIVRETRSDEDEEVGCPTAA